MNGYDLPPGAIPLSSYQTSYGSHAPSAPVQVVGGGGPAWTQFPHRGEALPPEIFSTAELVGIGAAGAAGVSRSDPMMIRSGDVITRPSGFWPPTSFAAGYNADGTREPANVISGPPVLDPNNRVLVPEHVDEHGGVIPAHWQHMPFNAIRLRVVPDADIDTNPIGQGVGAFVRVTGSAPFGGGTISREFFLTPSMEACLMAGKYRQFRVDVLALSPDARVSWEWFNDQSGICAETKLWSEVFNVADNAFFRCPAGAIEAFFEFPVRVRWQAWTGIAANLGNFDRAGLSALTPAGNTGVAVRGQAMRPAIPVGTPSADVNVQFRMSPI